ncbi:MAG TPA: DUF192 domain-containing protein [Steroidobacteraceae bacterium]|nr:DUF192 domain-containing protein [Steroidobacteraceae bacterium]
MKMFRILLLLVIGSTAYAQTATEPLDQFPKATLAIYTPDMHKHVFKIWVADTERRREQGLMYVKAIPADQGMLFVFDSPQVISMWMKNTLMPLDMVFITTDGLIESIATNTKPMSEKIIRSKGIVATVLELKGGVTAQLGIHAGAVVKIIE